MNCHLYLIPWYTLLYPLSSRYTLYVNWPPGVIGKNVAKLQVCIAHCHHIHAEPLMAVQVLLLPLCWWLLSYVDVSAIYAPQNFWETCHPKKICLCPILFRHGQRKSNNLRNKPDQCVSDIVDHSAACGLRNLTTHSCNKKLNVTLLKS